ncbi:LysR family transcriptional regulator [Noviherbaspirillum denitrificans]|uniref:LysR family transcriptional regulator n=1 Tax=Noviherbaspirillum denitrificans TaxID=1968433 RepID=UPI001F481914|nr:LysR family transcriptional regulator [Noviherbaspirillum denitrificans]
MHERGFYLLMNPFDSKYSDQIAAILALHEGGSFIAAGKLLQRHPTVVSKRISELETRLGVRLVERTTRHLHFTEAGLQYVRSAESARAALLQAEEDVSASAMQASGTLKLALPATMGRVWLAPLIAEFVLQHPSISVQAEYSDQFVDIVTNGFDAAIRIGELPDSRLKATKLCENTRILCASPAYLRRNPLPVMPADLSRHNCLCFTGLSTFPAWKLYRGGQRESVIVKGSITSNDNEALLSAALRGVGILACGSWLVSRELASGRLVQVLPEWQLDVRSAVYFVRPSARLAPGKTRTFKLWIEKKFFRRPPWSPSSS